MKNKENRKISTKHMSFIKEYIDNGLNATAAYMKVYPNVTYASAKSEASRLLTNVNLKGEIDARIEEFQDRYKITPQYIVNELLLLIHDSRNVPLTGDTTDRNNWNTAIKTLARVTGNDIQKSEIKIDGPIKLSFGNGFIPGITEEEETDGE